MSASLRPIAEPFVVAPATGTSTTTRLRVEPDEEQVLREVGEYLGTLQHRDLALRVAQGGTRKNEGRTERKRDLTPLVGSRWAGSITRRTNDIYERAISNLYDECRTLRAKIKKIEGKLAQPDGYPTARIRFAKQSQLARLKARLARVEGELEDPHPSIAVGGARLLNTRHNLEDAGLREDEWRSQWQAKRLFLTADGDADQSLGNALIKVDPATEHLRILLPKALAHHQNVPGRTPYFQLTHPVRIVHRADEWRAMLAAGRAIGYEITLDGETGRWMLKASWTFEKATRGPKASPDASATASTAPRAATAPSLESLQSANTLAIDHNEWHLACWVIDPQGNPVGSPVEIPTGAPGMTSTQRDGHLRHAITSALKLAAAENCASITIEDLNFSDSRTQGRERFGRGKRSRRLRATIAGIPTAKFRDRLVAMSTAFGISIIAVDPAYTSKWGARFWQRPMDHQVSDQTITRHHAAAIVIGRRGKGFRAYRRPAAQSHQRMSAGIRQSASCAPEKAPSRHRPRGTGQEVPSEALA